MGTRKEDKYFLDQIQFQYLKAFFELTLQSDPNSPSPYIVNSIYYDTKDLDFFFQKIEGEFDHIKIRNRWYDENSDKAFTEIKYKKGVHQVKKKLTKSSFDSISPIWNSLPLYPQRTIQYKRKAFEGNFSDQKVRVTFDYDLSVKSPSGANYNLKMSPNILMEVKYSDRLPDFLNDEFKKMKLKRTSFSKYAACTSYFNELLGRNQS